jgi:hypothetical protein
MISKTPEKMAGSLRHALPKHEFSRFISPVAAHFVTILVDQKPLVKCARLNGGYLRNGNESQRQ